MHGPYSAKEIISILTLPGLVLGFFGALGRQFPCPPSPPLPATKLPRFHPPACHPHACISFPCLLMSPSHHPYSQCCRSFCSSTGNTCRHAVGSAGAAASRSEGAGVAGSSVPGQKPWDLAADPPESVLTPALDSPVGSQNDFYTHKMIINICEFYISQCVSLAYPRY